MACTAEGMTDTGLKMERNEDAFLVGDNLGPYAVADGIGRPGKGSLCIRDGPREHPKAPGG